MFILIRSPCWFTNRAYTACSATKELESKVGRSGIVHTFSKITSGSRGRGVIERFSSELTALDVVATYAKALDVGAASVVIVVPSCSTDARELAEEYGMSLKTA